MMECIVLGDSIAVGLSAHRKECIALARSGIDSRRWNAYYLNRPSFDMAEYGKAIISLGSNDGQEDETEEHLEEIRKTLHAKIVYWIMPAVNEKAQKAVLKVARNNGDRIVYIRDLSKDAVHPTENGYKWLTYDTR